MTTIEQHADAILRAAGSELRHYQTQARIDIIEGVHDVYDAGYEAGRKAGWTAFGELMMVQLGPYMPDMKGAWQPIETLTVGDGYVLGWRGDITLPRGQRFFIGRNATFSSVMLLNEATGRWAQVSHWMPLPAAPKIQHSEGE